MAETIYRIDAVQVSLTKRLPPDLVVHVDGTVNSSGWSHPALSKYVYVMQPVDGVQDFGFVAKPPTGVVIEVLTPIEVGFTEPLEDWVKGVRIHAASNSVDAMLY